MFQFLADENFSRGIVRGLIRATPDLQVWRVQDLDLRTFRDESILSAAAKRGCIVLTHDRATMPPFAWSRVAAGQPMPGVFVFGTHMPFGQAINEILFVTQCSQPDDWQNTVLYFPL